MNDVTAGIVYHAVRAVIMSIFWAAILIVTALTPDHLDWFESALSITASLGAVLTLFGSLRALRRFSSPRPTKDRN